MNRRFLLVVLLAAAASSCVFGSNEAPADTSAECVAYCEQMADNCSDTFEGAAQCVLACEDYPSEPDDIVGDGPTAVDDNTVQCRLYHAGNAAAGPNGAHCQHASPAGGGVCVDFKGACGDYCGVVVEACEGADGAFASVDECENACNGMAQGQEGQQSGDTVHCRLQVANRVVAEQNTDLCSDALPASAVCVN